ncbi:MAG: glycoside hydrolase family 88 protein [Paludibacteraceae bacterium]
MPENNSHRSEYISTFQQMAAALKDRQRADGCWGVSLDDPNEYAGPETSGTAFFIYAIAWGINNGLLDSSIYYPVVEKAWNGLTTIAVKSNGFLGYVQGVGAGPAYAPETSTQDFGVGAFLLAGSEVVKLAAGIMPTPYNFGMKSVKAVDKNHVRVAFNDKVDYISGLIVSNYTLDQGLVITGVLRGDNDSTAVLTVSDLSYGVHTLTIQNIFSLTNHPAEDGETNSFSYSGIVAVTASGYQSGTSNTPDKTLDFDFDTRWSCDGDGAWIMYDLGAAKNVQSVELAFYSGNVRKAFFSIELSENGIDFTEVFSGTSSGTTQQLEKYDFEDTKARYVRIIGYGNSQSTWNSITETRINWKEIVSGIFSPTVKTLDFYPNPLSKGEVLNIQVTNDFQNSRFEVLNLAGKICYSRVISSNTATFQLNDMGLISGVYLLRLQNVSAQKSGMLVVK